MARSFGVVVNECSAITHSNPRSVNFRKTANNDPNLRLSVDNIAAHLPRELTDRELDWLELVASIYAADLACPRGDEGDVGWGRDIELHVPLREPSAFAPLVVPLQEIFADLTSDRLQITLHQEQDPLATPRYSEAWNPELYDCVALLSGGIDSYTGAVKLLDEGRKPILISHGAGAQTTPQKAVRDALKTQFGFESPFARLGAETVPQRFGEPEDSQRARTMLFMAVAALVAAVVEVREVYLNENGVMAVHVPLTPARMGSLSTKTAYPPIVEQMAAVASRALERNVQIKNNLVGLTKPEVAEVAVALGAGPYLPATASCWRWHRDRAHCGECIPCITRRISFEIAGVSEPDHVRDPFSNVADVARPFAHDNMVHLGVVVQEIASLDDLELEIRHPEILDGGEQITAPEVRDLYRRWSRQALDVLGRYPVPKGLIGL